MLGSLPLFGAGLTDAEILQLLQAPEEVTEWEVSATTSMNVAISDEPDPEGVPLGDGNYVVPTEEDIEDAAGATCGWAITNHDGSAFGRSARLTLQTDWYWTNGAIQGTPSFVHNSSVTSYGTGGGWRVQRSYSGVGWIGSDSSRTYRSEAKANWTLQACGIPGVGGCIQVGSGTAWARHVSRGNGTVVKSQGGWP